MELSFKPTVIVPKRSSKIIDGTIMPGDKIDIGGKIYDIDVLSFNIKGCLIYYTSANVKIMQNRAYRGDIPSYRPYKAGLCAHGVLTDNQTFIIKHIKK